MNCKNSIGILSVIIILLCGCQPDKKTTFTAASYNLRNANSADSLQGDGWGNRCPIIAGLVQFHEFDIFGTQEGLRHQLDSLKTSLPKYDYIGVGRNDGKKEGEHAAIFYRIDKFELLEHGDFWLSETPEKPSVGWDAVLPRICTWGHFKYKETGFEFLFFNLHMDHIGKQARVESALLVQQKMKEIGENLPALLTGDFNVDQTHRSYLNTANIPCNTSWKEGKIVLSNTPLKDALRMIGNKYNVSFNIRNDELLGNTFTGTFSNQSLDLILKHFSISSKIKFRRIDQTAGDKASAGRAVFEVY